MSEKPQKAQKQQQNQQRPPKQQQQKGAGKSGGGDKAHAGQKKKPQKAAAIDSAEEVKREQKLQAILMADSFSKSFRPTTIECPKVLLPLVNVPMLEYTLEFLAQNGVQEIFVFCVWHADAVEQYVNQSKWPSLISIRCISSANCLSAGDALRELDALNVIRSDPFILISGDVISNINLKEAIAFHKQKRKEDMNNVMTVVLKRVQQTAGAKRIKDDLVVAMNRTTSQIVLFDDNLHKKSLRISLDLMAEHPQGISLQRDLLDCNVDICSPELMVQFSDNFDYQDIRRHFIRNEVGNWELGKHIYGYLIQNEYAARVMDFRSYHSICRDIVTRWVFPLVPDAQLLQDCTYVHTKRYTYREQGVKVARAAQIGDGVVLSRGTEVGEHAMLQRSIVGRDCVIGSSSKVTESHIWEGAKIGKRCCINQAIICNGVVVGDDVVIPRGCVLSYGVVIGPGAVLPEYTHVSRYEADCPEGMEKAPAVLGDGAVGYIWTSPDVNEDMEGDEEEIDDLDDNERAKHDFILDPVRIGSIGCVEEEKWKRSIWSSMPPPDDEDFSDDDTPDTTEMQYDNYGNSSNSNGSGMQLDDGLALDERTAADDLFDNQLSLNGNLEHLIDDLVPSESQLQFAGLVGDMISTGHTESHPAESLLMEVKGLKFAQNKTFCDCLCGIVPALLSIVYNSSIDQAADASSFNKIHFLKNFQEIVKADEGWGNTLLQTMIQDTKEQLEIIRSIEDTVLMPEYSMHLRPIFHYMLQGLYNADVLSEEALQSWIAQREKLQQAESLPEAKPCRVGVTVASANICCRPVAAQERLLLFEESDVQKFVEEMQEDSDDEEEDDDDDEEEED